MAEKKRQSQYKASADDSFALASLDTGPVGTSIRNVHARIYVYMYVQVCPVMFCVGFVMSYTLSSGLLFYLVCNSVNTIGRRNLGLAWRMKTMNGSLLNCS